jgi:hypothetical protein
MKKILLLVLCGALLAACGPKKPTCEGSEVEKALSEASWAEFEEVFKSILKEDEFAIFKNSLAITVDNVETLEITDLQAKCKADFAMKVTDEEALIELFEGKLTTEDLKELEQSGSESYTVTLSEDKKSFIVDPNK